MSRSGRQRWIVVVSALAMAAGAGGCRPSLGPSKPVSQLTPQEANGHAVYQKYCASCHYADKTGDLHGPSLFALYRKKYLPSGAPVNDERVTPVIQRGRNMMPGYGSDLNDQQMQDLLAYLHTL
jgi:mono/diheme cytochrome c family protein